jgi:hypothetical protein
MRTVSSGGLLCFFYHVTVYINWIPPLTGFDIYVENLHEYYVEQIQRTSEAPPADHHEIGS